MSSIKRHLSVNYKRADNRILWLAGYRLCAYVSGLIIEFLLA